jgi:nucleoside-diphosphate-sugar epimerase
MSLHVVFGAGGVGSSTAVLLAEAGHEVRVVSRSGRGPVDPRIALVRADASSPASVSAAATGADVIYNCLNPEYHRWLQDWPPMAAALLRAATETGAVLVTMSNLYGYGPVDHPMVESDPLAATFTKGKVRAEMWEQALHAHRAGAVRVTEARASDFYGPGLTATSQLGDRCMPRVLAGKGVRVIGDPDVIHSYTYIGDVARLLVALGTDSRAWGRAWHVPTAPAVTIRWAIEESARLAGAPLPKVGSYPHALLRAASLVWPLARELEEVRYQHVNPFVLDSSAAEATFGLSPTPMTDGLRATVDWWRSATARSLAA